MRSCAGHEHDGQRNRVTDRVHHPTATAVKHCMPVLSLARRESFLTQERI